MPPVTERSASVPDRIAPAEASTRWTVSVGAMPKKSVAGLKRIEVEAASKTAAPFEAGPIFTQIAPLKYCHWPAAGFEPFAVTATPAKASADEPPETWSAASE